MKFRLLASIGTLLMFGSLAHATCADKEAKALKTAEVIGTLNGLEKVELSKPVLHPENYGQYRISIAGTRNGFYLHGTDYDITII